MEPTDPPDWTAMLAEYLHRCSELPAEDQPSKFDMPLFIGFEECSEEEMEGIRQFFGEVDGSLEFCGVEDEVIEDAVTGRRGNIIYVDFGRK